jgi:hypothetical protein
MSLISHAHTPCPFLHLFHSVTFSLNISSLHSLPPRVPVTPSPALPQTWARTTEEEAGSHQDETCVFAVFPHPCAGRLSLHTSRCPCRCLHLCLCPCLCLCLCLCPKPVSVHACVYVCLCPCPCVVVCAVTGRRLGTPVKGVSFQITNTHNNTRARSLSVSLSLCLSLSLSLSHAQRSTTLLANFRLLRRCA